MTNIQYPKTLSEAVNICLLTMTPTEKSALKNTHKENFIMFHFGWAIIADYYRNFSREYAYKNGQVDGLTGVQ
jgi:hypothetical protein